MRRSWDLSIVDTASHPLARRGVLDASLLREVRQGHRTTLPAHTFLLHVYQRIETRLYDRDEALFLIFVDLAFVAQRGNLILVDVQQLIRPGPLDALLCILRLDLV